ARTRWRRRESMRVPGSLLGVKRRRARDADAGAPDGGPPVRRPAPRVPRPALPEGSVILPLDAVVAHHHVVEVGDVDVVAEEPDGPVGHGDLDALGVPAAGRGLLERAARPGAHPAGGVVDAPGAV